jgi:ADP-heptose:LPS heptosyltransferase
MKVTQLQWMDRWLGIPLCWLLTLLRPFGVFRRKDAPIKKILFVKLAEQGSTVLAYPAIKQAIDWVGRENVYFIVFEDNRFILDAMSLIPSENIVTVPLGKLPTLLMGGCKALLRLRKIAPDVAVDLEFFARSSAAIAFLSGATTQVGFHAFYGAGPYRGNLMTHRLLYNSQAHTSDAFQSLVEAIKADPAQLPTLNLPLPRKAIDPPAFQAERAEVEIVRRVLEDHLGETTRLVLLNPNASDLLPLRRWPADRYVSLATRMLTRFPDAQVVFTGAPAEAEAIAELATKVSDRRCVSLAGKTTLRQLLILFSLAEVLVTNDSGPAHFASLTNIRVLSLFGPETPALFGARSERNVNLWAGLACSPCVSAYNNRRSPCQFNACMHALSVDQVFKALVGLYEAGISEKPNGGRNFRQAMSPDLAAQT